MAAPLAGGEVLAAVSDSTAVALINGVEVLAILDKEALEGVLEDLGVQVEVGVGVDVGVTVEIEVGVGVWVDTGGV